MRAWGTAPCKVSQFNVETCIFVDFGPTEDNPFSSSTVTVCTVVAVETSGGWGVGSPLKPLYHLLLLVSTIGSCYVCSVNFDTADLLKI